MGLLRCTPAILLHTSEVRKWVDWLGKEGIGFGTCLCHQDPQPSPAPAPSWCSPFPHPCCQHCCMVHHTHLPQWPRSMCQWPCFRASVEMLQECQFWQHRKAPVGLEICWFFHNASLGFCGSIEQLCQQKDLKWCTSCPFLRCEHGPLFVLLSSSPLPCTK